MRSFNELAIVVAKNETFEERQHFSEMFNLI